ncbi:hypothetical protein AWE51_05020 [Aquimarina aggregata]|uniref:Uncharacterized protein n=1 Tax=Aquimarina aggregata TaxID=1642818 RepID=A0A163A7H2_9FLAO|nr:hypothetical protein [Aquimarina aggregata]KZS40321.1 hypothetical protein AWE51_05020 [Aquimarina aggregata]
MKIKFILIIVVFPYLFSSCNLKEGGVRTRNNMEKYALEYINKNQLLEEGEKISAYYDYTISLVGTESVLLTNSRLIYHNKNTQTTSIDINDIIDIQNRTEPFIGDIIEVTSKNGDIMMIEIAPLNQGKTFLKVLKSKVNKKI